MSHERSAASALSSTDIALADVVRILKHLGSDPSRLSDALAMIGGSLTAAKERPVQTRPNARRYRDDPKLKPPERSELSTTRTRSRSSDERLYSDFTRNKRTESSSKITDLPPQERLATQPGSKSDTNDQPALVFKDVDDQIVPPRPLLDPRYERNILRELCSVDRPGREIDLRILLERLSKAQALPSRLPMRCTHRPARIIHVAADVSTWMTVYFADISRVIQLLRRYTNATVVLTRWLSFEKLAQWGHLAGSLDTENLGEYYEPGSSGTRLSDDQLVLFVSDLGYNGSAKDDQSVAYAVHTIAKTGAELAALVPVSTQKLTAFRPHSRGTISWDRTTTPAIARVARRGGGAPISLAVEDDLRVGGIRLARACSYASRATPRLLRALRMELFPNSGPEWEAQAWRGPYMTSTAVEFHPDMQPSSRGYATVDKLLLSEQLPRIVSWTRLKRDLRLHGWTEYADDPALADAPLAPEVDLGRDQTTRPVDWGAARSRLASLLQTDDELLKFLTTHERTAWAEELQALRDGDGCVFAEQAHEITRDASMAHPWDRFEEQLLWANYADSLSETGGDRVGKILNNLVDAMTSPLRLDEREMAASYAAARLDQMPLSIQSTQAWKSAVAALAEVDGRDVSSDEQNAIWGLVLQGQGFERYRRAPRQDVYAHWQPWKGWLLTLNPPKGRHEVALRFRVPKARSSMLFVVGGPSFTGYPVTLSPEEPRSLGPGTGTTLSVVTLAGDKYQLTRGIPNASLSFAELWQHHKHERSVGDWLAAGRWATRALSLSLKPRRQLFVTLRAVQAAIVTEDQDLVSTAIRKLADLELSEDPAQLRIIGGPIRALAHAYLLEIDSRLAEASDVCERAIDSMSTFAAQRRSNIASILLVRLYSCIIDLGIRTLTLRSAEHAVKGLEPLLTAPKPVPGGKHLWHRTLSIGLYALARYYFLTGNLTGNSNSFTSILRRADTLAEMTNDSEARYWLTRLRGYHSTYFESATNTAKLLQDALKEAAYRGWLGDVLSVANDYVRNQFNAGRHQLARLVVLEMLEIANQRSSRRRINKYLSELGYQLHITGRAADAEHIFASAREELPSQEEALRQQVMRDAGLPRKNSGDDAVRVSLLQSYFSAADTAAAEGNQWRDLLMLKQIITADYDLRGESDPKDESRLRRACQLMDTYAMTLGGLNMQWDIAVKLAKELVPDIEHGIPLLEKAYDSAVRLEVVDSALGILIDISKIHMAGSVAAADGVTVPASESAIDLGAALAAAERAIRFSETVENRSNAQASRAYRQRGEVWRRLTKLTNSESDARKALRLAKHDSQLPPIIDACTLLGRIEFDLRRWSGALDWCEQVNRELLIRLPYNPNYGEMDLNLIGDLLEERTLQRLKLNDQPTVRESFIANMPRAARLYRDHLILTRRHAGPSALSMENFWYWAEALNRSGIPEAAWFYRAALHRELTDAKPRSERMVQLVSNWTQRAEKLSETTGHRADLEFDPEATFDGLQDHLS